MITVRGFFSYEDGSRAYFTEKFENLGTLSYSIMRDAISKALQFPEQNEDGSFGQASAATSNGTFAYSHELDSRGRHVYKHIDLIRDDENGILFSSGYLTDRKGHISTKMKTFMENMRAWAEKEYEFAE